MPAYIKHHINIGGLAMDWINNKLYYVERGVWDQYIGVFDITTSKYKVLPIDVGAPYDIVVDPMKR